MLEPDVGYGKVPDGRYPEGKPPVGNAVGPTAIPLLFKEIVGNAEVPTVPVTSKLVVLLAELTPVLSGATIVEDVPVPTGLVVNGAVPRGAVPSGAVPSGAVPSGAVPRGAVPMGAVPTGEVLFPEGIVLFWDQ